MLYQWQLQVQGEIKFNLTILEVEAHRQIQIIIQILITIHDRIIEIRIKLQLVQQVEHLEVQLQIILKILIQTYHMKQTRL